MSDGAAEKKRSAPGGSPAPPARTLSLPARVRHALRSVADRLLSADLVWSGIFVVIASVLLLLAPGGGNGAGALGVGQAAPRDVVARTETEIVDRAGTDSRREAAAAAVPLVFVHDAERGARLAEKLSEVFRSGRSAIAQDPSGGTLGEAREALRGVVDDRAFAALTRLGFSPDLERDLAEILRGVMDGLIVGSRALIEGGHDVVLVHLPEAREERLADASAVLDLDEARGRARSAVLTRSSIPEDDRDALANLVASFVDVDVTIDLEATAARRASARAAATPVVRTVPAGTVLVRAGEKLTAETLAILGPGRLAARRTPGRVAGVLVVASLLAFFLYRYTRFHQRSFRKVRNLHSLLVIAILSTLILAQAILWIAGEVADNLTAPFNDGPVYGYLAPLAGGAILVALLAAGRVAMVESGFTAILFGAMSGWDAHAVTWALLVQWAGVYAITAYRERAALLRAGLVVGVGGGAAALAVEALRNGADPLGRAVYGAVLAFVGGAVGTGLLVSFALPLFERLFNVLTDIRLLELSNINNPLLSQLAVKAPGSYNHSLIVGTLAEEAAKAIGANSLFCRVAAFYHDVGKIRKPEYYVENQRGVNPHDKLSPFMSALIIAAHVKDGIRLSREAGLPEQIVDIVPQHHGTRVMSYFYDKARKSADPSLGPVSEADFRYPGPKPQTKEAAIFMLADAVEAAARTVEDPTPGRLGEVIHKMASAVVLDGQLDECDLTFADLDRIEKAFLRTLTSIYHHRVDYPGFAFGRGKTESRSGGNEAERRSGRVQAH